MRIYRLLVCRNALETNSSQRCDVESYLVPIQIGNAPSVEKSPNCSKDEESAFFGGVKALLLLCSSQQQVHSGHKSFKKLSFLTCHKLQFWEIKWDEKFSVGDSSKSKHFMTRVFRVVQPSVRARNEAQALSYDDSRIMSPYRVIQSAITSLRED